MKQYTLKEIASWQTAKVNAKSKITLPTLQRGLVWEASQIEKIWGSIFKGYPVGAITMSVNEKNGQRILLDCHQRSISIVLGHYNPFDEGKQNDISSLKDYNLSVWIDLDPEQINDYQHFVFRCSTKKIPLDDSFSIPLAILLEIGNEPSLSFDVFKTALFSKLKDFIFRTQYSEDDTLNYQAIKDGNLKKIYNGLLNYQQLLYLKSLSIQNC